MTIKDTRQHYDLVIIITSAAEENWMDAKKANVIERQQVLSKPAAPVPADHGDDQKKKHNYKLIVDAFLRKGQQKLYRVDGIIPGDPTPVMVTDPRSRVARLLSKSKQADLILPQFIVDTHYVGIPPPREVTFINLNDNINSDFLRSMIAPFGDISECVICYHPKSGKHLGVAKVVFETTSAARACVLKFDQATKMGSVMTVFTDPLGKERQAYLDEKIYDIPRFVEPPSIPLGDDLSNEPAIIPVEQVSHDFDSALSQPSLEESSLPPDETMNQYTDDVIAPPSFDRSCAPPLPDNSSLHLKTGERSTRDSRKRDSYYRYDRRDERPERDYRDHRNSHADFRGGRGDYRDRRKQDYEREIRNEHNRSSWCEYDEQSRHDSYRGSRDGYERDSRRDRGVSRRRDSYGYDRPSNRSRDRNHRGDLDNCRNTSKEISIREDRHKESRSKRHSYSEKQDVELDNGDTDNLDLDARIQMMLTQNLAGMTSPLEADNNVKDASQTKTSEYNPPHLATDNSFSHAHNHSLDGFAPAVPEDSEFSVSPSEHAPSLPPTGLNASIMGHPMPNVAHQLVPPGIAPSSGIPIPLGLPLPPGPNLPPAMPLPPGMLPPSGWSHNAPFNVNHSPGFHNGDGVMYDEPYEEYENESYDQFDYSPGEELPINCDEVLDQGLADLIDELQIVVNNDLQKKMITQSAFKFFEGWWKESENKKTKIETAEDEPSTDDKIKAKLTESGSSAPMTLSSLSALFDSDGPLFSRSILGMKAGVPKMPSFRRKISPEREEALRDRRIKEKEQKEKGHESDQRGEVITPAKYKRMTKKKTTKSDGNDSDSSSSSDEESSEESSSSASVEFSDSGDEDFDPVKVKLNSSTSESSDDSSDSESEKSEPEKPIKIRKPQKRQMKQKPITKAVSSESEGSTSNALSSESSTSSESEPEDDKLVAKPKPMETLTMSELHDKVVKDEATAIDTDVTLTGDEKEETAVDVDGDLSHEDVPDLFVYIEHNYSRPPQEAPALKVPVKKPRQQRQPKDGQKLKDITSKFHAKGNRELANILENIPLTKAKAELPKFEHRDATTERKLLYDIFTVGVDSEDISYLKRSYEKMLSSDEKSYDWCNDSHWVYHPFTKIPDPAIQSQAKRRRKDTTADGEINTASHKIGSARTEGYYKISMMEKAKYLKAAKQYATLGAAKEQASLDAKKGAQQLQREARSNQRRLATAFGDLDTGELLKFNQLKFRKKELRFSKSAIHDWGLFAMEPIPADTMVIEYVGAMLRHSVADEREKQYERVGIGSSYLFRVDGESVIDATKCGNLARFVNHCCDPNCYARVITVDGQKKIVIYSRRTIDVNEEITYDYKFPYEDEKIPCLCGAVNCRGTLN